MPFVMNFKAQTIKISAPFLGMLYTHIIQVLNFNTMVEVNICFMFM